MSPRVLIVTGAQAAAQAAAHAAHIFNVLNYGVVADIRQVTDGAITSGANTLTSATANFKQSDVGKLVAIEGAGFETVNSGAINNGSPNLTVSSLLFKAEDAGQAITIIKSDGSYTLNTTILTFTDGTHVVLAANNASGGNLTNATVIWAPGQTQISDGAISTGTAILTSTQRRWTARDIGKSITVAGAGVASGTLTTTIASVTNPQTVVLAANASTTVASGATVTWDRGTATSIPLAGTITAVTNATTATITPSVTTAGANVIPQNARGTVTNALVTIGSDNYAAIQTAYAAAIAAGGGTVYFPAGNYAVSRGTCLYLASNVNICGDGMGQSVIMPFGASVSFDANGSGFSTTYANSSAAGILLVVCKNCGVFDITVDKRTATYAQINGIASMGIDSTTYYCDNIDFVRCEVLGIQKRMQGYEIWSQNTHNARVTNCRVDGGCITPQTAGVNQIDGQGIEFYGCYNALSAENVVYNCNGGLLNHFGETVTPTSYRNATRVVDNFGQNGCTGIGLAVGENSTAVLIEGNQIYNTTAAGIAVTIGSSMVCEGLVISGNQVKTCDQGITLTGNSSATENLLTIVSNNTVSGASNATGGGILLTNIYNVHVIGNAVYNATWNGLRGVGAVNCAFIGNRIDGTQHFAIDLESCGKINVSGNQIGNYAVGNAGYQGIVLNNCYNPGYCTIEGNVCANETASVGAFIKINNSANVTVKGNRVSGSQNAGRQHIFFQSSHGAGTKTYDNDGTPVVQQVTASGTAYQTTNAIAKVTFGTTSPSVTVVNPGTYKIDCDFVVKYNAATFAAGRSLTVELYDSQASAIIGTAQVYVTDVITTKTYNFVSGHISATFATEHSSDDTNSSVVELRAGLDVVPTAGSLDFVAANLQVAQLPI